MAVKAIACELPARLGLPLRRHHVPDIRAEVMRRGLVASISDTTVWRWLAQDAIRPWTHRSPTRASSMSLRSSIYRTGLRN